MVASQVTVITLMYMYPLFQPTPANTQKRKGEKEESET
jgi:hypothetical protein